MTLFGAKRLHNFVKNRKKWKIMFLFLPDADFAVETDSTWVERCAYIFDDIFRINRFASTVPFHDFRAVRIQGFGEFVDGIFICVFSSDEVHRAYVHARERFCLSFVGIGRDSYSVKEGVVWQRETVSLRRRTE